MLNEAKATQAKQNQELGLISIAFCLFGISLVFQKFSSNSVASSIVGVPITDGLTVSESQPGESQSIATRRLP